MSSGVLIDRVAVGRQAGRRNGVRPCASESRRVPPRRDPGRRHAGHRDASCSASATRSSSSAGAGAASGFPDDAYAAAGATIGDAWAADIVLKVNAPTAAEIARLRDGRHPDRPAQPGAEPRAGRGAGGPADHRARDGRGAAHLAGAVAGRAQLDGQHRRLPRGHRGRARVRPVLHRPGHRGRQGAAGQGAGGRRRRGRAGRDRRRVAASARSCGPPTRGPRWPTRSSRSAASTCAVDVAAGGQHRRLRQGDLARTYDRRAAEIYAEQAADVDIIITTALIPGRPAPRLITAERRRQHEAGQRHRRHGRAQGGNVEGTVPGRGGRHRQRRHDHRLHRPGRPAAGPGVAALRHQPGEPHEAADARPRTAQLVLDFDDVVQRSITVVRERREDLAAAARCRSRPRPPPRARGRGRPCRRSTPAHSRPVAGVRAGRRSASRRCSC